MSDHTVGAMSGGGSTSTLALAGGSSSAFAPSTLTQGEIERANQRVRAIARHFRDNLPKVAPRQHAALTSVSASVVANPGSRSGAATLEERLIQRTTYGWNVDLDERVRSQGWRAYLDQQLEPEQIDDGGLEQVLLDGLPTLSMAPYDRVLAYRDDRGTLAVEIAVATFFRALYSPRQLFERVVELWNDHLHTSVSAGLGPFLKADYDQAIRSNAFGSFRDLIGASAHSPAMLEFLTNNTNRKGAPNENYARELMELHTLGVDGGYTQDDVKEVARALTGWSFFNPQVGESSFGYFQFLAPLHDTEQKVVLGQTLPAGQGIEDGEQVLDALASHPSTAEFIARKLLVQFWGYQPKQQQVERVAQTFADTGGDIREMLRAIITWHDLTSAPPKLKRPFHLATSALRSLFAGVEDAADVLGWTFDAGHFPFNWSPPNGYPDSEGYWSGSPLGRWNFANRILAGGQGINDVTDLLETVADSEQLLQTLDALLFGGSMDKDHKQAIREFLTERPFNGTAVREAVGLAASSPDFQYY